MTALAATAPIGRPPRIMHSLGMWAMGRAGRQLYEVIWIATDFGTRPRTIPDWRLAQLCGRSIRWVQKALRQLEKCIRNGVLHPIIRRFRVYGRRDVAGRAIEIVDVDALPDAKVNPEPAAPAAPSKAPPRPKTKGTPGPPAVPATPEELAAARARIAAVNAPPPEPTPEDQAASDAVWAAIRKQAAELDAKDRRKAPRIAPSDPRKQRSPEEEALRLQAHLKARAEQAQAKAQAQDKPPAEPGERADE